MASVLFIITIPTEVEENRLMQDFLAKKSVDLKSEHNDNTSSTVSTSITKLTEATTTTSYTINTTSIASDTTTTTAAALGVVPSVLPLDSCDVGRESGSLSGKTLIQDIESPTNNGPVTDQNSDQYSTISKRKKYDQLVQCIDDYVGPISKPHSAAGSLRDIGFMDNNKSWQGSRDKVSTSSIKQKLNKKKSYSIELSHTACMEQVLKEILRKFQIQNAVWSKDAKGRMYQICFPIAFDETYEKLLENLNEWGFGDREGSTILVMNCINCKTFTSKDDNDIQNDYNESNSNLAQKQGAWDRFMNSVRSRLNVVQIVRDVRQNAAITFDFVVLLVAAAILASFGLVEDSTIFLASSMLISPLMGPIIAVIFGTVIKDSSLGKLGVKNELFGIFIAIFVGFTFGLIICTTDERYSTGDGLTTEMLSRCELHSLLVGLFTAVASGAAAAIGILGGNIGSLVGVAISASLLPPAVNSGVLWSLAVIYKIYESDETRYNSVVKSTTYSSNQATELAVLGSISMCLTISNVFCIYIMGILVLKVKEIAPVISRNNRQFWKHDIKIARDLKRSDIDADIALMDEFANLPEKDQKALGLNYNLLRTIQSLDDSSYQNTWSPFGTQKPYETHYEPIDQNYTTIHRIERLYSTISNQKPSKEKRYTFGLGRKPEARLPDLTNYYKLLGENAAQTLTTPSKVIDCPSTNIITPNATITAQSTTSGASKCTSESLPPTEERKRRKFIVTPADDPLRHVCTSDDVDV